MAIPFVLVELDKTRKLRFGLNALIMIEQKLGMHIADLDLSNLGVRELLVLIYAGLHHEDKDLSIEKLADIIDEHGDLTVVITKMAEALNAAFGEQKN